MFYFCKGKSSDSEQEYNYETCEICEGNGYIVIDCDECEGSGAIYVDCDECNATGKEECSWCLGKGGKIWAQLQKSVDGLTHHPTQIIPPNDTCLL